METVNMSDGEAIVIGALDDVINKLKLHDAENEIKVIEEIKISLCRFNDEVNKLKENEKILYKDIDNKRERILSLVDERNELTIKGTELREENTRLNSRLNNILNLDDEFPLDEEVVSKLPSNDVIMLHLCKKGKISAIKAYRALANIGLKEAKDYVDNLIEERIGKYILSDENKVLRKENNDLFNEKENIQDNLYDREQELDDIKEINQEQLNSIDLKNHDIKDYQRLLKEKDEKISKLDTILKQLAIELWK